MLDPQERYPALHTRPVGGQPACVVVVDLFPDSKHSTSESIRLMERQLTGLGDLLVLCEKVRVHLVSWKAVAAQRALNDGVWAVTSNASSSGCIGPWNMAKNRDLWGDIHWQKFKAIASDGTRGS